MFDKRVLLLLFFSLYLNYSGLAQKDVSDTVRLEEITVTGYRAINGIGHFHETDGQIIYAGKKTEIIEVDSIDANKAVNNTRQILGRIPGMYIVESETGGFVANGIGIRGLNPVQSLEMNVRQNGYNVAADVYGYNETYYLPPMEAVSRVEVIKGAAAIQFGSQLGGMVNYVIKEGNRNSKVDYSTMQIGGSDGLFNSYHSIGGTINKWSYFTFLNYRNLSGWRPNSQQEQLTGYGKISYRANEKMNLGIEYSLLRNKIKMPGGLTDEQFEQNSRQSVRSRNWLKSPWNILTATLNYELNKSTSLAVKSTFLAGERSLVWVNKLPGEPDALDPATGEYQPREVDKETMRSNATEIRILRNYSLGNMKSTMAAGIRIFFAVFDRKEEAEGTNKSDFDMNPVGDFEEKFHFTTTNLAAFIENSLHVNERFSITPGIRFETLSSEAEAEIEVGGIEKETETEKERGFILMGLGLQYEAGIKTTFYGNISQSFRPVDYAQLVPLGSISEVDPNLEDPKGWNADVGIRGSIKNIFNYDFSVFYLSYSNRIGIVNRVDDAGMPYLLRTNVDKSVHKGIESYAELNIAAALGIAQHLGNVSVFNSFAYTNAKYTEGNYKGNMVEYAPEIINRVGITYSKKMLSTSLQLSDQTKVYTDPANTQRSGNPVFGIIAGYSIIDWAATLRIHKFKCKGGINNLTDKRYFTQRTDEYPGPGIIPSTGRSFYLGVGYNL